ncbi:MAG: thioredoxin family protein [Deltaproteobacteria bacterium]|nr:thioredoxin family protein [Deltaproteobacteria bacterium]MBW2070476.1 thioredoxin family protein [Deltaproteobacteria bacterium]
MVFFYRLRALALVVFIFLCISCGREPSNEKQRSTSLTEGAAMATPGRVQVKWLDFDDGLAKAQSNNKPLFIHFYTEWCLYCKKFNHDTLQNRKVARMLAENFVSVRLEADSNSHRLRYQGKTFSNADFSRYFGVTAFPTQVFLDASGQPITMIPGYMPASQFLTVLSYIQKKCYLTKISFHEFARSGTCN